jgi:hypothetical protein
MSQQERKEFKKAVKSYKKEVTSSKEASQKFLIELGIFTNNGRLRKEYKNLCIPQGQA